MIKIQVSNKIQSSEVLSIFEKLEKQIITNFQRYREENGNEKLIKKFEEVFGNNYDEQRASLHCFLYNSKHADIKRIITKFDCLIEISKTYIEKIVYDFNNMPLQTLTKNAFKKLIYPQNKTEREIYEIFVKRINEVFPVAENVRLSKENKHIFFDKYIEYKEHAIDIRAEIEKIINYDMLGGNDRHTILTAIGVKVCPYCNRQYISSWREEGEDKTTGDLDHFFSKSKYPIASLCLYNFIPSCQICNSRFKLQKDFLKEKHIYPYEQEFGDDAKFEIDNIEALMGENPKFSIHNYDGLFKREIDNSIHTFHINELYENHSDIVKNIILNAQIYNEIYLEDILESYTGLFSSKEELKQIVFHDEFSEEQKPFEKLRKDIMDDIGIKL
ncbi:TPA: hypothetical protein K8G92_002510 [Listeria monocytogenes]|nr:hypothetical protein [Listeria monocytogenes]